MIDLTQLTPTELDKLTKAGLIAAIVEGQRIDTSLPIERDKYGNAIRQLQRTKDAYGKVIEEKVIRWTYYGDGSTGEVNEIITEDAKERVTVKHTLDGAQPTLVRRVIAEPIPLEAEPEPVPEPLVELVPLRVVEAAPLPAVEAAPEPVIEVPQPTRWERFKKRAEKIFFLLPDDVV